MTKIYTVSVPDLEWDGNIAICARDTAYYEINMHSTYECTLYFIKSNFAFHCGNYCSDDNCKKAANEDHVKYCLRGLIIYD